MGLGTNTIPSQAMDIQRWRRTCQCQMLFLSGLIPFRKLGTFCWFHWTLHGATPLLSWPGVPTSFAPKTRLKGVHNLEKWLSLDNNTPCWSETLKKIYRLKETNLHTHRQLFSIFCSFLKKRPQDCILDSLEKFQTNSDEQHVIKHGQRLSIHFYGPGRKVM